MGRGGGRPALAAMAEPAEEEELPVPGEWGDGHRGTRAVVRVAVAARFPHGGGGGAGRGEGVRRASPAPQRPPPCPGLRLRPPGAPLCT